MEQRIVTLKQKHLIGIPMEMSLSENKSAELWQTFMPRRSEIKRTVSSENISLQNYNTDNMLSFSPETIFTKWALAEVEENINPPEGMKNYSLEGGLYSVFIHKGPVTTFRKTMMYIFSEWLPNSKYGLDLRPHFEILPKAYHPMDPEAKEEVWIPIKI